MSAIGYYLLICECDECHGDESLFRGIDKASAWRKASVRGWKSINGRMLCIRCAPATVCRYCGGVGCLACRGEKERAREAAGMKVLR